MLTTKGGPVSPLPFIPSSFPLSIHPGSGILELFVSNTSQRYSPKASWIFPGLRKIGTAVCSQAIRKTTFLPSLPSSHYPSAVLHRPPTSRGLRRIQGWQLPSGRAPSSRFLRILTPFSPFFLYRFFFCLSSSYKLFRYSQFRPCILSEC